MEDPANKQHCQNQIIKVHKAIATPLIQVSLCIISEITLISFCSQSNLVIGYKSNSFRAFSLCLVFGPNIRWKKSQWLWHVAGCSAFKCMHHSRNVHWYKFHPLPDFPKSTKINIVKPNKKLCAFLFDLSGLVNFLNCTESKRVFLVTKLAFSYSIQKQCSKKNPTGEIKTCMAPAEFEPTTARRWLRSCHRLCVHWQGCLAAD